MALTPGDTRKVLTEVWLRDHKLERRFRVCVSTCQPYLSTVVRLMVCRYHCVWLPNRKQRHVTKKIERSSITDSFGGGCPWNPRGHLYRSPGEKHIQNDLGHQSEVAIQILLDVYSSYYPVSQWLYKGFGWHWCFSFCKSLSITELLGYHIYPR